MSMIPTEEQWGDWKSDVDTSSAYKIFYGKSNDEIQEDFYRCVIERADELRYMPDEVFQYYIEGFNKFIMAGKFQLFDASDAADSFLKLVEYKLKNSYESIDPVLEKVFPVVEHICDNQEAFEARIEVYGDFKERLNLLRSYLR